VGGRWWLLGYGALILFPIILFEWEVQEGGRKGGVRGIGGVGAQGKGVSWGGFRWVGWC